uniref:tRNA threonylcarbamoyladenosine biosynthesis protein TsaE n=2 Tax=Auxenochlorella protothecoides TaxID=3075 RepID=A0A1D2ACX5_AUXPR
MILLRLPPSLGSLACRRLRASRWVSSVRCMHSDARIDLISTGPEASDRLAEFIASASAPGDAFLLYGEVGAGKSHFSRAFIRAALKEPCLDVPSPTYLLQNTYEDATGRLYHHYDLYRLTDPSSLARLDLPSALAAGTCLIEWPERLGACAPAHPVTLRIACVAGAAEERRLFSLSFPDRDAARWVQVVRALRALGHRVGLDVQDQSGDAQA